MPVTDIEAVSMNLIGFNSYFTFFAGLNLSYASSQSFRRIVDEEILQITNAIDKDFQVLFDDIDDAIKAAGASKILNAAAQQKRDELKKTSDERVNSLKAEALKSVDYTTCFKSMFLNTSFFCFFIIILSGFSQFFNPHVTIWCLTIVTALFIYNMYIFRRSFTDRKSVSISTFFPVLLLSIIILFSALFCIFCPVANHTVSKSQLYITIIVCLIIAISSYLLHFWRVYLLKKKYREGVQIHKKDIVQQITMLSEHVKFFQDHMAT